MDSGTDTIFWSNIMKEILIVLGVIGVWYLLQAYILPKIGISTWVKDACQVASKTDHDPDLRS